LRGVARWLSAGLSVLVLLLVLATLGLWWWSGTQASLDWVLSRYAPPLNVSVETAKGSLRDGVTAQRLRWSQGGLTVEATGVALAWDWRSLLERRVLLSRLHAASVEVTDLRPPSAKPATPFVPPLQLSLPLPVEVQDVRIGRLAYRGALAIEVSEIAARYAYEGAEHALDLQSLVLPQGRVSGQARLGAQTPLPLNLRLQGELAAPVPGRAQPLPLALQASATGRLDAFDAELRLQGRKATASTPAATVTAHVTPWAPQPLPQARAELRHIDLAALWSAAPRTSLSGTLVVAPSAAGASFDMWQVQADLANALPGPWDRQLLPLSRLNAQGQWRGDGGALVQRFDAQLGGGEATGSAQWLGPNQWQAQGRVNNVDPARLHSQLAPLPLSGPLLARGDQGVIAFEADLNAAAGADRSTGLALRQLQASGQWTGNEVALQRLLVRSNDARLQGQLTLVPATRFGQGSLTLEAPGLRADVVGSLSQVRGGGTLRLDAPQLAQALAWVRTLPGLADAEIPAVTGQAHLTLDWQGGWRDPRVRAQLQTPRLVTPAADGVTPWTVRRASLAVDGRLSSADVQAQGEAQQGTRRLRWDLRGTAGQAGAALWQARLDTLEVGATDTSRMPGEWQLRLQGSPLDLRLHTGTMRVETGAGRALLVAPVRSGPAQARLSWEPMRWGEGQAVSAGRLVGLPLSWIELFTGRTLAGTPLASSDLLFDADWALDLGTQLRLRASLARTAGDLSLLAESVDGAATRVAAGIRQARITLLGEGDTVTLGLLWDSERAGQAQGNITTRLVPGGSAGWQWPADAAVKGQLSARLPRLRVWSLLAPPGWRLRGSLAADLQLEGTRADPIVQGRFAADDLVLRSVVDGIALQDGRLRARLEGRRMVLEELLFRGSGGTASGGTLRATGEASWTPTGLQARADVRLERLRTLTRSDRQLTVSGQAQASTDGKATQVAGQLRVDQAIIVVPEESAPRLGEDVAVRNLPPGVILRGSQPAAAARPLEIAVNIDLGDDFRVSGRGANARLRGRLDISGQSLAAPRLAGTVLASGSYLAYGERLTIERGELRFTGPADNPALDILAVRPNLLQKAGVQVTGRAQSPVVRLYSNPALSDAETLSWLVLGRSAAGGGAEAALVQRAAFALLGQRAGGGLAGGRGIAGMFGLDELSVRRDGTDGAAITLGRRFADNFYASYERTLSGALGTLFIFYELSQRLTVRAEAGERTGVDLIYSFSYD